MNKDLATAKIRKTDRWGSGAYKAPRGNRLHKGVDIVCDKGDAITSASCGVVRKTAGRPYAASDKKKKHYRYVEIMDASGLRCRYFYVAASVKTGDMVCRGDVIGAAQGLEKVYPGITDHIHFEVLGKSGPVNPLKYLKRSKK